MKDDMRCMSYYVLVFLIWGKQPVLTQDVLKPLLHIGGFC